ncbi:hypothetical protein AWRI1631_91740 [Saccharomyces cerevisiae AWRI1631]|uniref:Uncharacterized protein n=1 Tax=Saccharomyces cerevisiae (strain AWRI1631) TaxID=545124 RepID=B5VKV9_YEAS6|nr:hypothetical protein AWRI1631_91740 [Saccharomyces cerevisiae AWRI1631]
MKKLQEEKEPPTRNHQRNSRTIIQTRTRKQAQLVTKL